MSATIKLPFAAIPHDLASDSRLLPIDLAVACAILKVGKRREVVDVSNKSLAQAVGRSVRTVQNSLKRLANAGWIDIIRKGVGWLQRRVRLLWLNASAQLPVPMPYEPEGCNGLHAWHAADFTPDPPPPPIRGEEEEKKEKDDEDSSREGLRQQLQSAGIDRPEALTPKAEPPPVAESLDAIASGSGSSSSSFSEQRQGKSVATPADVDAAVRLARTVRLSPRNAEDLRSEIRDLAKRRRQDGQPCGLQWVMWAIERAVAKEAAWEYVHATLRNWRKGDGYPCPPQQKRGSVTMNGAGYVHVAPPEPRLPESPDARLALLRELAGRPENDPFARAARRQLAALEGGRA